jgi:hypothetical protein
LVSFDSAESATTLTARPPYHLHPRPEEFDAAACDYQAVHGLTYSRMCEQMRQYGALTEIHERAQVIALMRLYANRWRPWDPEGRRDRLPSRQPRSEKRPRKRATTSKSKEPVPLLWSP